MEAVKEKLRESDIIGKTEDEDLSTLIKINRDILKTKEEQLNSLSNDSDSQSQKTQQLLGFFGAVSAIIFSQDWLNNIPWPYLGIIFSLIIAFLIVCLISFQGRFVEWMISVDFWNWKDKDEVIYLQKKINAIQKSKDAFHKIISQRNNYNKIASIIFIVLIFIYSFIFLIYNPMTENKSTILKWSDVQIEQETAVKPESSRENITVDSSNGQEIGNERIIKTGERDAGKTFTK